MPGIAAGRGPVRLYGPQDQLQVEWISATEVRAWHPQFNPEYGPQSANYKPDNPIKLIFKPKP